MNDVDPQVWLAAVLSRIAIHSAHRLDLPLHWIGRLPNAKASRRRRLDRRVNKVRHVFTLNHVAEMLGEDEEWLFEVVEEMDTEDGQLWVVGVGEDGVMAFTDDGIENLRELIAIHKDDPSIIEKRRQVLAAIVKPKAEKPDEV